MVSKVNNYLKNILCFYLLLTYFVQQPLIYEIRKSQNMKNKIFIVPNLNNFRLY